MSNTKHPLKSKIIGTNLISLVALAATIFGFDLDPEIQAKLVAGILAVVNLASIIFRFGSNTKVSTRS